MKLRWSHAVMYVRDLDKMLRFYCDVLGFEISDRGPVFPGEDAPEVVFLSQSDTDHHQIAFAAVRGDGPSTTLDHIAFRVESFSDVKEMAKRVEASPDATGIDAINHGNAWSVYFNDPEENRVEVFCDSPWAVKQPQIKPWDLSMSEQELRKQTEDEFHSEPDFQPMQDYYDEQRRRHGK